MSKTHTGCWLIVLLVGLIPTGAFAMLHPQQGRFMQRDPLGYVDDADTYECEQSQVIRRLDPSGLITVSDGGYVPWAGGSSGYTPWFGGADVLWAGSGGYVPWDGGGGDVRPGVPETPVGWWGTQYAILTRELNALCLACAANKSPRKGCVWPCKAGMCSVEVPRIAHAIMDAVVAERQKHIVWRGGWTGNLMGEPNCEAWATMLERAIDDALSSISKGGDTCLSGETDISIGLISDHNWATVACRNGGGTPVKIDPWKSGGWGDIVRH